MPKSATQRPHRSSTIVGLAGALALVGALAAAATTLGQDRTAVQTTVLISKTPGGAFPNGASRHPVISGDLRVNEWIAYESEATNLVDGDTNGVTDIFLVQRSKPYDKDANQLWQGDAPVLASRGLGGAPANGRSYGAALDGKPDGTDGKGGGTGAVAPRCLAFVSDASNLVGKDTNGKADAFVYDLVTKKVTRVSVDGKGKQAKGSTFDVTIDGECQRVAFTSDAANLALTKTKKKQWKGAVTKKPKAGTRQVYVRYVRPKGSNSRYKGLTYLASASNRRPGNGHSFEPSLSQRNQAILGFASNATNLDRSDRDARSDIYVVETGGGLKSKTRVVSVTTGGQPGNGVSTEPSVSEQGFAVAYQTTSTDLGAGDANGAASDIVNADITKRPAVQRLVTAGGNGPSLHPHSSLGGSYVFYETDANNLGMSTSPSDTNGARDVLLFTDVRDFSILESRSDSGQILSGASYDAHASNKGNYLLFVSESREGDSRVKDTSGALPQVFMRYLGGR